MARTTRDRSQDFLLGPLGEAIRQVRVDRGLSQERLADLAEIERSHMGRIERGEANLSFLNLMKIAKVLKSDLSGIIKLAGY